MYMLAIKKFPVRLSFSRGYNWRAISWILITKIKTLGSLLLIMAVKIKTGKINIKFLIKKNNINIVAEICLKMTIFVDLGFDWQISWYFIGNI